ncbi:N-acetylmuramoyl-L-alanine amidase-like domain-containing protein [Pontibacter sp. G13]|uniref:N-acetylmuramoyl-L-alanine amidase-like domain-containing protein n=1 Tax=Pontibacter sp. G13 TaxID=3074898 RepID=UPI002889E40A|nr:N-acetylmuramoyl-L-alanine amidase-like domain-containing protein [Pontibacter sp. G13]WNJ21243.1 DUF1460 domain-containing protein [Pontibacter sp. G13]
MKSTLILMLLACLPFLGWSQTHCTAANRQKCEEVLTALQEANLSDQDMSTIAIAVGKLFLGTPYVAKTLELDGPEKLVVNLEGLDCTTFMENVVVFSRLVQKDELTWDAYQDMLAEVRYRDGQLGEYPDRLHYATDWFFQNEQKGIIEDITQEIGGIPYEKHINFMSTHPTAYTQLASSDEYVKQIADVERAINDREYCYIPKERVKALESGIQSGDLIAITTPIKGLDVVHVGLAIRQNGRIHLFHASTGSNEVEISSKPLAEYLAGNRSQSGIMVARLQAVTPRPNAQH